MALRKEKWLATVRGSDTRQIVWRFDRNLKADLWLAGVKALARAVRTRRVSQSVSRHLAYPSLFASVRAGEKTLKTTQRWRPASRACAENSAL